MEQNKETSVENIRLKDYKIIPYKAPHANSFKPVTLCC